MAVATQNSGFLTLLKKRNFLRLWLAQLISMTILNASNYALLVLIEEVTGSTTLVGLAIICFSLPAFLFSAPAGVFVDRMDKRRVLWGSNCLRAIATFIFVISLLFNRHQLVPVYLLTFLVSVIGQFFSPAEGSSIPLLVKEDELMPALSLFNITFMLSQALGFILLAPIALSVLPLFTIAQITIHPVDQLYIIIGVLYLVCALLVGSIPVESFKQKTGMQTRVSKTLHTSIATETLGILGNVWSEILQGWRFIRRNKRLFLSVVQLSFAGVLILVIGELATPIVTNLLHLPPRAMAFVFAPAGIGLVLGSIFMPRITIRIGRSRAIFIGTVVLAIATLLLPLTTIFARSLQPNGWNANPLLLVVIAFFMFCAGFGLDFVNIPAQTAMQEQTPDWIKGRVLALQLMLYNAFAIPIILFIGAFADLAGIDKVLYLMSICSLGFGLWGLYYQRKHPREMTANEEQDIQEVNTSA
ncbi:MAG: MFS transporter [Ktedonobacteraceae bacterium]